MNDKGSLDCHNPVCGQGPVRLVEGDDDVGSHPEDFNETYECAMCERQGKYIVRHDEVNGGTRYTERFTGVLRDV